MKWFLYFMSIYFITMGITFILYTDWLRRIFHKMVIKVNLRWFTPLPFLIGLLFILSKDYASHPWFNVVLGILILGKGCYLLLSPKNRFNVTLQWWINNVQDTTYRFWGIVVLILGMALFSWCK